MANKKVKIDVKPKAASIPNTSEEGDIQGTKTEDNPVLEVSNSTPEPAAVKATKEKPARATKKAAHKQAVASVEAPPAPVPEKTVKMKRLTLDISKPLHKAIKAKAVEEGISIVDMLRALLKEHYGK